VAWRVGESVDRRRRTLRALRAACCRIACDPDASANRSSDNASNDPRNYAGRYAGSTGNGPGADSNRYAAKSGSRNHAGPGPARHATSHSVAGDNSSADRSAGVATAAGADTDTDNAAGHHCPAHNYSACTRSNESRACNTNARSAVAPVNKG